MRSHHLRDIFSSSLSNIYQQAHDRADALEDNLVSNLGKRFSAVLKKFFRYQIPCVDQIADGNLCFAENIINSLTLITEKYIDYMARFMAHVLIF